MARPAVPQRRSHRQSADLKLEVELMRGIERAYARVDDAPPKVQERVLTWAGDMFHGDVPEENAVMEGGPQ